MTGPSDRSFLRQNPPATRAAGRLGSPERGAVADRRAVTEGLRPAWIYPPASPPVVGEGFHALPAWEDGLPRIAYNKWCAGCAREIAYVGRWTRGRRTVGDVGAVGHAERPHTTHPGGHTTAGRRGRRPLRATAERRCQHRGKQMCKRRKPPPTPWPPPERGAVAARSGVTEGLVQRGCDAISLPVILRKGRRGRRPLRAGARHTRLQVWQRMRFRHAYQIARGLRPRNCIRWVVDARRARRG